MQVDNSLEININIIKENKNDFLIHLPERFRKIYNVKGTISDYKNFINKPNEICPEGIIFGLYPPQIPTDLKDDDKFNFDVVILENKQIIHQIAGNIISSNKDITDLKIIGAVFCSNIDNIEVNNNDDPTKYNILYFSPKGEPNYPSMIQLNIQLK